MPKDVIFGCNRSYNGFHVHFTYIITLHNGKRSHIDTRDSETFAHQVGNSRGRRFGQGEAGMTKRSSSELKRPAPSLRDMTQRQFLESAVAHETRCQPSRISVTLV